MEKFVPLALLVFAPAVSACFQTNVPPITLNNTNVKVHFAYEGKDMGGDPVTLWSRKKGKIARGSTDKYGWCVFKDVPAGEYKVVLLSPSYESFEVVLTSTGSVKTWMAVEFKGDYCQSTRVSPER